MKIKGLTVNIEKDSYGHYNAWVTAKRFKGTRRQEYISERIITYKKSKPDAMKIIIKEINSMFPLKWNSSGLFEAKYLPK